MNYLYIFKNLHILHPSLKQHKRNIKTKQIQVHN